MIRHEEETKRHPTFDPTCIEALASAEKLACELGVREVGPQYLFVCLLEDKELQVFLSRQEFEYQPIIEAFRPTDHDKERYHPKKVRYSPKVSVIVNRSLETASANGSDRVTPREMLAATLETKDPRIMVLFRNQKVTLEELQIALREKR